MKQLRGLRVVLFVTMLWPAVSLLLLNSCKKDRNANGIGIADAETGGGVKLVSVDFVPSDQTITPITLKNYTDASVHVKLAIENAGVQAAGARVMPANTYTIGTLEYDIPANGSVNVPFMYKGSVITIDTIYGIGLKIAEVSSGRILSHASGIILKFDFRNRWDGRYKVTGSMVDIAAPTLGHYEHETNLITRSATTLISIPKELGIPGYLILSGTSLSYYGSFGPVFHLNNSTNKVVAVTNSYGQPASNTRSAEIDPTGV